MKQAGVMSKFLALFIAAIYFAPIIALADEINMSDGVWFRCEFAHSQIPPEDNCRMLDDDGFQVIKGIVHHVKITNSKEIRCRHNRVGNCFLKNHLGLRAERTEIGPIELSEKGAAVTWFGCTQNYSLTKHLNYIDIVPVGELCWWTPDKHYYVERFRGLLKIVEEE
jgi:hypothetical protein